MIDPKNISIQDYTYQLPEEKIALHPIVERDSAKLLVYNNGDIKESVYKKIHEFLPEKSLLVFNDTRVIKARIRFQKPTGGIIEIFCLEPFESINEYSSIMNKKEKVRWKCMIGGAGKWKEGELQKELAIGNRQLAMKAKLMEKLPDAYVVEFFWLPAELSFAEVIEAAGDIPLPPYIKRKTETTDTERYQTIYAKDQGSVAAPTAGLHFSKELIKRLEIKGIRFAETTLHTGLGTFRPIEVEDLSKHKMDAEYYAIDETACAIVNKAKTDGRRICSVGTTTMRSMESSFTAQKLLKPSEGWTNMFIHPPYNFSIADSLVTNFHLPKTSLLIMTCAFGGYELIMEAYKKAIKDKYRFFSYGDALLVL